MFEEYRNSFDNEMIITKFKNKELKTNRNNDLKPLDLKAIKYKRKIELALT